VSTTTFIICPNCGEPLPEDTDSDFCSDKCQQEFEDWTANVDMNDHDHADDEKQASRE
jgi:endogenous inhibitor of DNA gyrase (YacG/DUF329 family)